MGLNEPKKRPTFIGERIANGTNIRIANGRIFRMVIRTIRFFVIRIFDLIRNSFPRIIFKYLKNFLPALPLPLLLSPDYHLQSSYQIAVQKKVRLRLWL